MATVPVTLVALTNHAYVLDPSATAATHTMATNGTTKGQFKNLRVSGVTVTPGQTDDELKNAIRVMVVCGAEIAFMISLELL